MPPRQVWIFKCGCWIALAAAVLHLAGDLAGPQAPVNETERQLTALASTYRFTLPGGTTRSLMDSMHGFSLSFAMLLATIGMLGLIVQKRGRGDAVLMSATARVLAVASVTLLVISIADFFVVPSMFIAAMAVCFLVASVEAPQ